MFSIFSTQNLQTFLRRKNLRPPSRGGPPGPERPPKRDGGRSPPERGPSPAGRSPVDGVLVSSAIILLHLSAGSFAGLREPKTRTPELVLGTTCAGQTLLSRCRSLCRSGRCGCCRRRGRRCRGSRLRTHLFARVAELLDLVQPLLLFINANGEELDYRLSDAQTALEFMHDGTAALNDHQDVKAVMELAHGVCQA